MHRIRLDLALVFIAIAFIGIWVCNQCRHPQVADIIPATAALEPMPPATSAVAPQPRRAVKRTRGLWSSALITNLP